MAADGSEDRWVGERAVYLAEKLGTRLSILGIMNRHLLAFRGGIHYGNSTTELRWESRVAVDGVKKLAGPAARGGRQGPGRRGRALRLQSVDELRAERVTVREESAESRSQEDRRRIFLRLDGWDLGEHSSSPDGTGGFLDKDPDSEVELVVVSSAATTARANLLGLLTKSDLGVAVCGDDLRVWRPRGAPGFWGLRGANRSIRYNRRRVRELR